MCRRQTFVEKMRLRQTITLMLIFASAAVRAGSYTLPTSPRQGGDANQEFTSLRDAKEVAVYLKARETKQYSFRVNDDDTSLWLVVTPCGGTLKWKLTQQTEEQTDDDLFEDSEESSAYGVPQDDTTTSTNTNTNNNNQKISAQSRPTSKYDDLNPNNNGGQRRPVVRETMLVREVGRFSMEYLRENMPAGILHLYLTADENETSARVYATVDSSRIDAFFPKLPRKHRLTLSNISTHEVSIAWEHSPSVNLFKQSDITYCAVLSAAKDYATYCEFLEEGGRRRRAGQQRQTLGKSNAHQQRHLQPWHLQQQQSPTQQDDDGGGDRKLQVSCMQYKTAYRFVDLEPDTKYYLSLFAVNAQTGGSSAYEGASFVTSGGKVGGQQGGQSAVRLHDGRMHASYLNPARSSFRLYEFYVPHYRRQILVSVQPCSGYVRVHLYKDGKMLRKSVFSELKVFQITNVQPGVLRIKVVNDDNDAKVYKIWTSSRPSRNPYPTLPFDTSIKSVEQGRSCQSVQLAWLGSTKMYDYCLYKRMERDDYFKQLILEESSQCQGPAAEMQQVFCRRFKVQNETQLIMKAAVLQLKPATTYRFDLYASKPNRHPLSYRTVWVKTKRHC